MALLELTGLYKEEKTGFAVRDVRFSQEAGENIAIIGETGSGKTSVLKMIAGLIQPDRGDILLEGQRVRGPFEKLLPGHPRIAYLSQHFELRNNYRVEEELESKNLLSEEEAQAIYAVCRISHLLKRKTTALSGGERQRIVLARLLTMKPSLLLLDEPFSNLDLSHTHIIRDVLKELVKQFGISCIMVSHDAADLLSWAHRILIMRDGQLVQDDTPQHCYEMPADQYCAGLLGEYNLLKTPLADLLFPGIPRGEKQWILRPEQLEIKEEGAGICPATVLESNYCGSHYIIMAEAAGQPVQIRAHKKWQAGTKIGLSLSGANAHLI